MIKGIGVVLLLALGLCSFAEAGNFYFGPTLLVQDISANQSRFRGLHPRLSVGYGNTERNLYVAGEIFAIPATLTLSDTKNRGATSTKASTSIGASFIPGTRLYQELWGYARLGFINSKFSSPNTYKWGTQLGFGLQTDLTPCFKLRGEYVYTIYNSVSTIGTPNSNELGVGFVYLFDR